MDISGSTRPNNKLKVGKLSLAQASVNWKFVTVAPDILGLFLSASSFCLQLHANRPYS